MKKQIKPNATGIQTFFKSAPKDFVVQKKVAEVNDGAKKFYVDILKEKLRNIRDENGNNEIDHEADGAYAVIKENEDHTDLRSTNAQVDSESHNSKTSTECTGNVQKAVEKDDWEEKYKQEVEKRKALKKIYVNLTIRFSELDSKYNELLKTTTSTYRQSADDEATSNDIFTPNEVKFLQCMQLDKEKDCSFIHTCLKFAYKLDPSVLVLKTLKGTPEWTQITIQGEKIHHPAKAALTPKKVDRIKGLFIERVSKCEIDSVAYRDRIKDSYVNVLFAAGINNISKKYK